MTWDNELLLREDRSLLLSWDRIPRTIQDGITLTREIGEDYLWVDALCICQDDREDQNRQIIHMGSIFQESFLTIIADCGDSASYGLPGVRPGTWNVPQLLGRAGGSVLCNILHTSKTRKTFLFGIHEPGE
jgi:hypothetical protein